MRTLKAISSVAPFLGLAGTSYGILASLFVGFGLLKSIALHILSVNTAATLITTAAGILVAIPAILVHNFLCSRIDRFKCEFSRPETAGYAFARRSGPTSGLAQTLPLTKVFSRLPPFALIAAPTLASVVAMFLAFEPYGTPTGLGIRLLPIGALDGDRLSHKPVIISIFTGANGSPVIRVNSRETPPNNLEEVTRLDLKLLAEPRVYVEAESTVAWADVTNVIAVMKGLNAEVVLLTATPDASSGYTPRSASP